MNKFNKVAQTVLSEAEINPKIGNYYRQISDLLSKKGLRAHQYNDVMKVVQKAITSAFKEGMRVAEANPFK